MMKGLEGKLYKEQLRSLGLLIVEETEGRPQTSLQFLHEGMWWGRSFGDQQQDSRAWHEALSGKIMLDIRIRFFTQRVVGHWKRLPR